MNGSIVRRVMTGLPASSWVRSEPMFKSVKILATMGNGSRRYFARIKPFVPPTYNELPVPFGSWEKDFQKKNDRYNKQLGVGITFFLITIFVVSQSIDFNSRPPPLSGTLNTDNDLCPPPAAEKKCT